MQHRVNKQQKKKKKKYKQHNIQNQLHFLYTMHQNERL
jgi:hypothetical protein